MPYLCVKVLNVRDRVCLCVNMSEHRSTEALFRCWPLCPYVPLLWASWRLQPLTNGIKCIIFHSNCNPHEIQCRDKINECLNLFINFNIPSLENNNSRREKYTSVCNIWKMKKNIYNLFCKKKCLWMWCATWLVEI